MAKIKFKKRTNWITVFFFQLCVIANNVVGHDKNLFVISKIIMLLFFGVVLLQVLQKGKVQYNHILLIPILFTVYCGASMFWAYEPNNVVSQMVTQVQLLLLMLFTFWAMHDGVTLLDYVKAVYLSGYGLIALVIVQQGGPIAYINKMLDGVRIGGMYSNTFGMVFSSAALSATYYMILRNKKKHFWSFLLMSLFALSTGSRKAVVIIIAGVIGIALLHYGWRRLYKTILIIAGIVVLSIWILQMPYFKSISLRVTQMLQGETSASDFYRQEMIAYGWELIQEKPVFGYGLNNYTALYFRNEYAHNNYIEVWVGGGIVGLILYYLMLLIPVATLFLNRKKGEKLEPLQLIIIVFFIMEMACGIALVQLYRKNSWILIGVLMAAAAQKQKKTMLQEKVNESGQ